MGRAFFGFFFDVLVIFVWTFQHCSKRTEQCQSGSSEAGAAAVSSSSARHQHVWARSGETGPGACIPGTAVTPTYGHTASKLHRSNWMSVHVAILLTAYLLWRHAYHR